MKILVLLIFLLSMLAPSVRAHSLVELDAILTEASSLREFLSPGRASLRARYFEALQNYYGPIAAKDYEAILSKLTSMEKNIPELGARLWETTGLGESFSVEVEGTTYGRSVETKPWTEFVKRYKQALLLRARDYYTLDKEARHAKLKEFSKDLTRKIQKHHRELEARSLTRKGKERLSETFYRELKSTPEFDSASAYALHRYFNSEYVKDILRSNSADNILGKLKELDARPETIVQDLGWANDLATLLKPQIPKLGHLLADERYFPHERRTTNRGKSVPVAKVGVARYDFIPFPRRFHGIWKGLRLGECVATSCTRFGTVAVADTQLYAVESGGLSRGFVQILPGEIKGQTYGSIDLGSPLLAQILKTSEGDPTFSGRPLYERVLGEFERRIPAAWQGIVVGKDYAINNAGVLPSVHASASFTQGEVVGQGRDFHIADPVAKQIEGQLGNPSGYGPHLIFDAGVKGNAEKPLVKLNRAAIAGSPLPVLTNSSDYSILIEPTPQEAIYEVILGSDLPEYLKFVENLPRNEKTRILSRVSAGKLRDYARQVKKLNLPEWEVKMWQSDFLRNALVGGERKLAENDLRMGPVGVFTVASVVTGMLMSTLVSADFLLNDGRLLLLQPWHLLGSSAALFTADLGATIGTNLRLDFLYLRPARHSMLRTLLLAKKMEVPISPQFLQGLIRNSSLGSDCRRLARELKEP